MGFAELFAPRISGWPRAPRDLTEEMAALIALRGRMGDEHFGARMRAQVDMMVQLSGLGKGGFHFENVPWIARAVEVALWMTRTAAWGRRNAAALSCHEHELVVEGLPHGFEGLRVLHLSDLHLDAHPGFGRQVAEAVAGASFDLCVITGDFRFLDMGRYEHLEAEIRALAPVLRCEHGVYGVLGNHDFLEMVPLLESHGIRMLMNEAEAIQVDNDTLWIAGLDDPHLYGMHDFQRALEHVPEGEARLLLVHSPEVVEEAADLGFCVYLTGHTHGGQFCLPGGGVIYVHARCSREYAKGLWRAGSMVGYTSRGVGASGVFARFNCPPEIVVHRLVSRARRGQR